MSFEADPRFSRQPAVSSANWAAVIAGLVVIGLAPIFTWLRGDISQQAFFTMSLLSMIFCWGMGFALSDTLRASFPQPQRSVRITLGITGGILGLILFGYIVAGNDHVSSWLYVIGFGFGTAFGSWVLSSCWLRLFQQSDDAPVLMDLPADHPDRIS